MEVDAEVAVLDDMADTVQLIVHVVLVRGAVRSSHGPTRHQLAVHLCPVKVVGDALPRCVGV